MQQQPQPPVGQQQRLHHPHHQHHHPPPSPKTSLGGPGSQLPIPGSGSGPHLNNNNIMPSQPGGGGQQVLPNQQLPTSRILELVDALKHEVELIHEEAAFSKHHRKDLEGKLASQISEMAAFQKSIYELDRMHHAIKAGYEEDIKRLRHELESRGIPIPPSANPYAALQQQQHSNGAGGPPVRRHSLAPPDDMAGHNKRLKDANSNPVPSPRHSEPRGQPMPPMKNTMHPPRQSQEYGQAPRPAQPPVPQHAPAPAPKADELVLAASPRIQNANVNVEQVHSFDHGSVVCCVKFSPDGKYLATGCNHFAQIFEISSGRKILALVDESVPKQDDLYIRSVCFSPDGVYLATGAEDRIIRIWDIVNGKIKVKLSGHAQDIYSLDWTKDGKSIVSGSGDHTVKIWDPESGACVRTLQNGVLEADKGVAGKDAGVTSVAIRPTDGRCVVAASLDEMVRVWDLRTGHLLERFEGHENSVYSVAFSPDGLSIISGSLDQTLRIWDLSPQTLSILSSPVSPDKKQGQVFVSKAHRHMFSGHKDYVLSVGYPGIHSSLGRVDATGRPIHDPSFDVEWVISGSKDRLVVFWDAKDSHGTDGGQSSPVLTMTGHKNSVISIAMGPTGGLFATGSGDMKARVWRVSRPQPPPQALPAPAATAQAPSNGTVNPSAAKPPSSPKPSTNAQHTLAPVLSLPVMNKPKPDGGPTSATSPTAAAKDASPKSPIRAASPPAPAKAINDDDARDEDMDD